MPSQVEKFHVNFYAPPFFLSLLICSKNLPTVTFQRPFIPSMPPKSKISHFHAMQKKCPGHPKKFDRANALLNIGRSNFGPRRTDGHSKGKSKNLRNYYKSWLEKFTLRWLCLTNSSVYWCQYNFQNILHSKAEISTLCHGTKSRWNWKDFEKSQLALCKECNISKYFTFFTKIGKLFFFMESFC